MNPLDFIAEKNEFQATFTNITNVPMVCGMMSNVAAPTFTQVGNVVTITCATTGATIKYSTDGETYSTYANPITIAANTSFSAYAQKSEMYDSTTTTYSAVFVETVATPTATCVNNVVTMSCATTNATILYSTDGENFSTYESQLTITETTNYTIKAQKEGMLDSATTTYTATFIATVENPVVMCSNNVVEMECDTQGATIKYNTDGSETYSDYSEPITITETTDFYVKGVKEGMLDSSVETHHFEYV